MRKQLALKSNIVKHKDFIFMNEKQSHHWIHKMTKKCIEFVEPLRIYYTIIKYVQRWQRGARWCCEGSVPEAYQKRLRSHTLRPLEVNSPKSAIDDVKILFLL